MTIATKQVTFYVCPHCEEDTHKSEASAQCCCLCTRCEKVIGRKQGASLSSYGDWLCDSCFKSREVGRARDAVKYAQVKLAQAKEDVARWESELTRAEANLAETQKLPTNRKREAEAHKETGT